MTAKELYRKIMMSKDDNVLIAGMKPLGRTNSFGLASAVTKKDTKQHSGVSYFLDDVKYNLTMSGKNMGWCSHLSSIFLTKGEVKTKDVAPASVINATLSAIKSATHTVLFSCACGRHGILR